MLLRFSSLPTRRVTLADLPTWGPRSRCANLVQEQRGQQEERDLQTQECESDHTSPREVPRDDEWTVTTPTELAGPAPRGVGGVGVHPGVMIAAGESPGAAARARLTRPPRGITATLPTDSERQRQGQGRRRVTPRWPRRRDRGGRNEHEAQTCPGRDRPRVRHHRPPRRWHSNTGDGLS
jgi:hypothetical protein